MYLGLTLRRDSCSRVSRTRVTAMINQNFRPAGAHCPSSVACCRHCRRDDRLNPFNDDARENKREEERRDIIGRGMVLGGDPAFLGPAKERGDPCSDKACPVFPSLLLISFRFSFQFPFFTFLRRDRWPSPIQEICLSVV